MRVPGGCRGQREGTQAQQQRNKKRVRECKLEKGGGFSLMFKCPNSDDNQMVEYLVVMKPSTFGRTARRDEIRPTLGYFGVLACWRVGRETGLITLSIAWASRYRDSMHVVVPRLSCQWQQRLGAMKRDRIELRNRGSLIFRLHY